MIADILRVLALSTIASSAAIVMILLLRKPLRLHFGAQAAYALWTLAPLAVGIALLPAPTASVTPPMTFVPMALAVAQPVPIALASPLDPVPWLGATWLLGLAVCAALFIRQQRRFVRRLGSLWPIADRTFRAQATAGCPALIGAWRPRIVLPADFECRYDSVQRGLIRAHERAHCARGDAQANAFATALRCLYWFNPLIHFAVSHFRFDQELACDAVVIARFPEARRPYADAMLKTQLADLGLPAGCHWQSSHPLKERITMLKQPLPGRQRRWLGGACVAVIVTAASFAVWTVQPAAAKSASASNVTSASYRKISRISYPEKTTVAGYCVVVITFGVDTAGTITDMKALKFHGNVHQPMCAHWAEQGASSIMRAGWTFEPAKLDGKAVAGEAIVPLVFTARPNDFFDSSPIPTDALDAIRISAEPAKSAAAQNSGASEHTTYRSTTAPVYPKAAIQAKQQGKIVLQVKVDAGGNPVSAKVYKAEPPEAEATFAQISIDAVMKWKFNPAQKDGQKVSGDVLVPFTYSLTEP